VAAWDYDSHNTISREFIPGKLIGRISYVPKEQLLRIISLCIDLSELGRDCSCNNERLITQPINWRAAGLDKILRFVYDTLSIERLTIKFSSKELRGSLSMTKILQDFCHRVSEVDTGTFVVILAAFYFDEDDESRNWCTVSGPNMSNDLGKLLEEKGR